ncbi:serine/threonine-protein kinase [Aliiruegeria lutimaris]|nr:serine/threonine-protein kinase [Aliiruegeria lutimaris]
MLYPSSMCCRADHEVRARTRSQQVEFDTVVRLFVEEARRLAKLDHPNIVGVHDVFEDNGTAYMALDYVEGRDLLDVIEAEPTRLGPPEIRKITHRLLDAVIHVHDLDILHRDISPDNVLLDRNNEPILIDFGAARDTARRASRVLSALQVVKDGYSPQEFYLAGSPQSPAGDLYSLGATLHHLLTGAAPANSHMRLAALAEQRPDPYKPLKSRMPGYDDRFLLAIDRALNVFAKDRVQTARQWRDMIDGTATGPVSAPLMGEKEVAARIQRLVADTNAAVKVEMERAERERREREAREAQDREAREQKRIRLKQQAMREAEEAANAITTARMATEQEPEDDKTHDPENHSETLCAHRGNTARPRLLDRIWRGFRRQGETDQVGQMEGYGA